MTDHQALQLALESATKMIASAAQSGKHIKTSDIPDYTEAIYKKLLELKKI